MGFCYTEGADLSASYPEAPRSTGHRIPLGTPIAAQRIPIEAMPCVEACGFGPPRTPPSVQEAECEFDFFVDRIATNLATQSRRCHSLLRPQRPAKCSGGGPPLGTSSRSGSEIGQPVTRQQRGGRIGQAPCGRREVVLTDVGGVDHRPERMSEKPG